MNFDRAGERYRNDADFHRLVDVMMSFYDKLQFTPSELKEAAVFSAYLFEARHPKPMIIPKRSLSEQFEEGP